jgi:protein TonB
MSGNSATTNEKQSASLDERIVSLGVINGKATCLVTPSYSPAAKAVHASGVVNVEVVIDEEGNVVSASAVSGHPLLKAAAEAAARASKFISTVLSGRAVKVKGIVVYNF